ncbi:MAG: AraC family transcriptional regulator [Bacteroidota bacterium]
MNFDQQLLFFFSALGAFNGLFLSLYFAFFIKNRSRATYFLSALIFVISVRVVKSVFLTFYPGTSGLFIQIGLTACFLIGPFLYIYVREVKRQKIGPSSWLWLLHVVPVILGMILIGYFFPYYENRRMWWRVPPGIFGSLLFSQWLLYIIFSGFIVRDSFRRLFRRKEKVTNQDFWVLNVVIGVGVIWLAYNTTQYTSYIVGALSFSFTLYLSLLIWVFKRRKSAQFFAQPVKYAHKRVSANEAVIIKTKLSDLFSKRALYTNPNLKLKDVASAIEETPHALSEYLNDDLGKSFNEFINGFRVNAAKEMLQSSNHLTIEAIGNECGFKSNSTFYGAFKKDQGMTPAQFKKESR